MLLLIGLLLALGAWDRGESFPIAGEASPAALRVLHRSQGDGGLLVVDKPFGVRMDGDFELTVEKLVRRLAPPVAGPVRFVHQLDFATSGCLMIALDKATAARMRRCFDAREVLATCPTAARAVTVHTLSVTATLLSVTTTLFFLFLTRRSLPARSRRITSRCSRGASSAS